MTALTLAVLGAMKKILSKLSVSRKILLANVVPLIFALGLISVIIKDAYNDYTQTQFLIKTVDAVTELSEIVHFLQFERAANAKLINKVKDAKAKVDIARNDVDKELEGYQAAVSHLRGLASGEIARNLTLLDRHVLELAEVRSKLDKGQFSLKENKEFYSATIHEVFLVGMNSSEFANNVTTALEIVALVELAEAKEFASKEKYVALAALGKGQFTVREHLEFNEYIASQKLMLDNFIANEPELHREEYRKMLDELNSKQFKSLRERLLLTGPNKFLASDILAPWSFISSSRINELRAIEKKVLADIVKDSHKVLSSSFNLLWTTLLMAFVALGIVMYFGSAVSKTIQSKLKSLTQSMNDISSGNLDVEVEASDVKDEISEMTEALLVFRDNAVQKIELEKTAEETRVTSENERAEREAISEQEGKELSFAVEKLGEALGLLAEGDLTVQIDEQFNDKYERLRNDFNAATTHLASALGQVRNSIDTINTGTDEMRIASDDLSVRTETQASSLQNLSESMKDVNNSIQSSATDSANAASLAKSVAGRAKDSMAIVEKSVSSIKNIDEKSKGIATIISVIEEIAFQTSLLALNAGVEAARAGDAGKGFAVVAQEVRELANRSAQSSEEISELINTSLVEVEAGVSHVVEAGDVLTKISSEVSEISAAIESIAHSSLQQSERLKECTETAGVLDQSTQQNAAMAEQSTAVMHSLAQESVNLNEKISGFSFSSADSEKKQKAA